MDTVTADLQRPLLWTLLYTDDVMLAAENKLDLQSQTEKWSDRLPQHGLRLNLKKSEYMTSDRHEMGTILINGEDLTRADIGPSSTSDDETMGPRRGGRLLSGGGGGVPAPPYSKQDIREQYCITSKQLDVLERHRASSGGDWLLGCLSSYQEGTCRAVKRSSLLSVCVRRRAPSDENLPELCRRPLPPPPPPPPPAQAHPSGRPHKHVSFARSHTLTSFDVGSCSLARSRERLVDGKERAALRPQPPADGPKVVVLEKLKRAPMKTQATQTDVCLGRRPLVPNYLSLSPRTIHRVRMVSQFAQTNGGGVLANGRGRLMKSFSEAGGCFADGAAGGPGAGGADDTSHEPLQRTQSEEPPRSPFLPTASRKILIDFEPAPVERRPRKRLLQKTLSEGEMLRVGVGPVGGGGGGTGATPPARLPPDEPLEKQKRAFASTPADMEITFTPPCDLPTPYASKHPCTCFTAAGLSAAADEDEFHENLIFRGLFRKRSVSLEDAGPASLGPLDSPAAGEFHSAPASPEPPSPPPTAAPATAAPAASSVAGRPQLPTPTPTPAPAPAPRTQRSSPSASCDSLAAELRTDHSDGIWNESQATVTRPDCILAMTPSSRRKHLLLLQHQQRSSMDTDALDEELDLSDATQPQQPLSPRICIDAPVQQANSGPSTCNERLERYSQDSAGLSPRRSRRTGNTTMTNTTTTTTSSELARTDSGRTNTDLSETSEDYVTADGNSHTDTAGYVAWPVGTPVSAPGGVGAAGRGCVRLLDMLTGGIAGVKVLGRLQVYRSRETLINGVLREWTEEERRRRKKTFRLDFSPLGAGPHTDWDSPPSTGSRTTPDGWRRGGTPPGAPTQAPSATSTAPRRSKVAQAHRRQAKKCLAAGMVRSPAMHEGFRADDWAAPLQRSTPGHSPPEGAAPGVPATGCPQIQQQAVALDLAGAQLHAYCIASLNANGTRAPVTIHLLKKMISTSKQDTALLQKVHYTCCDGNPFQTECTCSHVKTVFLLAPPPQEGVASPEAQRLKALSAESLRSVSPGSDSVFYSEAGELSSNTMTAATDTAAGVVCHHCGREVAVLSGPEELESTAADGPSPDIVQPPAGFADSPEGPRQQAQQQQQQQQQPRLYKKAKSEERGRGREDRVRLRPLARSTDASMETLHLEKAFDNVDWSGVYAETYKKATWIYIGETEEVHVWQKPESRSQDKDDKASDGTSERRDSLESTISERDFRRKYQAITHRMVHRKATVEMYRRLANDSFDCDKTVVVRRQSGEFGFRIHGSKPVVVSAIEPDTPAESSGLEVGDIVITVNGHDVLDASHSEVVKLAHAGSETLKLGVARTANVLTPVLREPGAGKALYSGFLWRLGGAGGTTWVRRWFSLKRDNCLYYYKTDAESLPLGALMLHRYAASRCEAAGRQHCLQLARKGGLGLTLAADSEEALTRWLAVLSHAIERNNHADEWLEATQRALRLPASSVLQPDCAGYLTQIGPKWRRRFCVLKDACLYFYQDSTADSAIGMACLHGYRVQNCGTGEKRLSFEVLPPDARQRHFYFHAESELDKKKWLAALEYSIDRWIRVG
ncbi:uncharacterized protein LOC126159020 [Schistocerca cancellata]|uniref:uncharacterized protein LOC126159020 n=1 Tax=Schistocerca cancellata TaxID=274614 RepID=UPI002118F444|nr:uncharacterized protein LOC126159020 [Schistocerca cancellata]